MPGVANQLESTVDALQRHKLEQMLGGKLHHFPRRGPNHDVAEGPQIVAPPLGGSQPKLKLVAMHTGRVGLRPEVNRPDFQDLYHAMPLKWR